VVIARMAEGSLRDALSLLEQARAYCGDTISDAAVRELLGVVPDDALDELVQAISAGSTDRALALVHTFQKEGRNLQHFCLEAIRHMRNLLITRVCGADSELIAATPDQRPGLARDAAAFSEEDLTRFFQILLQTDDDLRRKPDPRLHLEMGLLRLVNASRLAPLEELLGDLRSGSATMAASVNVRRATPLPSASSVAQKSATSSAPIEAAPTRDVLPVAARPEGARYSVNSTAAEPTSSETPRANAIPSVQNTEHDRIASIESAQTNGLTSHQLSAIKTAIQAQQKFLGELVEHGSRWELDGAELRIYFSSDKRWCAEMLEGRDSLEKVRAASSKVLGRTVRVCAKLEAVAAAAASASRTGSGVQELRAQFERDPMVKSMLQRFGGRITEVKDRSGES